MVCAKVHMDTKETAQGTYNSQSALALFSVLSGKSTVLEIPLGL